MRYQHFIAIFTDPQTHYQTAYHYSCPNVAQLTAHEQQVAAEFGHAYVARHVETGTPSWRSVIEFDPHFKSLQVTEQLAKIRAMLSIA